MSTTPATIVHPKGHERRAHEDLLVVLDWLRRYVSQPAPQLGRRGPVCPFVPPALNANALRFTFRYDIDGQDPDRLHTVLLDDMRQFQTTCQPPASSGNSLASLLVVLPNTGPAGWATIDQVYSDLKDQAVGNGLMIGQFHPACAERAVRNPSFPVSRSPIPLFALRHMAPHDILFLHQRREWFDTYHQRFAPHFRCGRGRDPLIRQLYDTAIRRYGIDRVCRTPRTAPTTNTHHGSTHSATATRSASPVTTPPEPSTPASASSPCAARPTARTQPDRGRVHPPLHRRHPRS